MKQALLRTGSRASTETNTPATIRGRNGPTSAAARSLRALALAGIAMIAACSDSSGDGATPVTNVAGVSDVAGPVEPKTVVLRSDLASPWALAFLPDGRMLVTQKGGQLLVIPPDGRGASTPLAGVPAVSAVGQGGLLDVAVDPDFAASPWIYLTYAEPGTGGDEGLVGAAVGRGRLVGGALQDFTVLYRQSPKLPTDVHFGTRLAFLPDGTLVVATGERGQGAPAQDPSSGLGKVVRIRRDGSIPSDNPAVAGGFPGLYTLGHRNPQGLAVRPGTSEVWLTEHGPLGGDELNRLRPGSDYGWPAVSYGCDYGRDPLAGPCAIGGGTHAPRFVEPVSQWTLPQSIAPSGLVFYTGTRFPQWTGSAFFGALAGTALWRIALSADGAEIGREKLLASLGQRIRSVAQGPDGYLYLLTDSGRLIQVRD